MPAKQKPPRKPTRDAEGSIFKRIETRPSTNGRTRKETVYYVRVRKNEYDEAGSFVKQHELKRKAPTFDDAVILRRRLRHEIKGKIETIRSGGQQKRIRFFDLLDFYEKHYVKEAVFSGTKKIAGQRTSIKQTLQIIGTFREFFGNIPVAQITYPLIFDYKLSMQAQQYKIVRKIEISKIDSKKKREFKYAEEWRNRKPATVHRYLARLQRILQIGVQQGFANVNPFTLGDPLIEIAVETTRTRICGFIEEQRILAYCVPPRAHLRNVVICAIDTFLRKQELFSLIGSDVDFDDRIVTIRERNTKTLTERSVPLSDRACQAFLEIQGTRSENEWRNERVFSFKNVKTAWYTALRLAEIDDLHFHDLRGTGITRMLDAGIPAPIVMKYSGHRKYETFMKYVKKDLRIMQDAAAAMSRHYLRLRENAKGHTTPSNGRKETAGDISEVVDFGESVN